MVLRDMMKINIDNTCCKEGKNGYGREHIGIVWYLGRNINKQKHGMA